MRIRNLHSYHFQTDWKCWLSQRWGRRLCKYSGWWPPRWRPSRTSWSSICPPRDYQDWWSRSRGWCCRHRERPGRTDPPVPPGQSGGWRSQFEVRLSFYIAAAHCVWSELLSRLDVIENIFVVFSLISLWLVTIQSVTINTCIILSISTIHSRQLKWSVLYLFILRCTILLYL